jgi:hypothetical protein
VYLSDQHSNFAVNVTESSKRALNNVFGAWTRKNHGYDKVRLAPGGRTARRLLRRRAAPV